MLQTGRRHPAQDPRGRSRNDADYATPSARRTSRTVLRHDEAGKADELQQENETRPEERLHLLLHHFTDITMQLRTVSGARTDIIDAYACLWTARRVAYGKALSLTADTEVEVDSKGLKAEIMV